MLDRYLTEIAAQFWESRMMQLNSISSPDQVAARQAAVRAKILAMLGPFPPRTPLNPRITGSFLRNGYRVENVLFESRPGNYVTANLYIPTESGAGPFPAILGSCGHSNNGKASTVYQRVFAGLAKLGFVVLVYDPPGQGERFLYFDPQLSESVLHPEWPTTVEHTMAGIQCLLTGSNAANYFVWDGIRGIDYLLSRPEVDPDRIGATGNSGGGTLTAYIAAVDERVKVAVPSCYITRWDRLWTTIGPQDSEQCLIPFISEGLDFSDFIISFAPKPYLVNTAIRDFFPILGARASVAEGRRIYELLGSPDNLDIFEADDEHGYTRPRREAAYQWLGEHLLGLSGPWDEAPLNPEPDHLLQVTSSGQVSTEFPGSETVGSLNAAFSRTLRTPSSGFEDHDAFIKFKDGLVSEVRTRALYSTPSVPLSIQDYGSSTSDGMHVQLLAFDVEPGITLPVLLARPASQEPASGRPVIYLSDGAKTQDLGTDIRSLVEAGHIVLAPDLRGQGETARGGERNDRFADWFSPDYVIAMKALMVGRSLVGMRTVDIMRSIDLLESITPGSPKGVIAMAKRSASVPLLHAATVDERITELIIEGGLISWQDVVDGTFHRRQLDNVVNGALQAYDLPELAAALAPRRLVLSSTVDRLGHPVLSSQARTRYGLAESAYGLLNAADRLVFMDRDPERSFGDVYGPELDQERH
jgi:cephalosporin-C deacetylase-like acetyl esterase